MLIQAPQSETTLSYSEALLYCFFLEHNSQCGWRMPTTLDVNNSQRFQDYGFQHNAWRLDHPKKDNTETRYVVYPVKDV